MDLLGVGPLELVFVLLIIFLVLGPDDLVKTGRKMGKFMNSVRKSEFWQGVTQITKEVRTLPNTLMREAQLEETKKELEEDLKDIKEIGKEFDMKEVKNLERDLQREIQGKPEKSEKPEAPEKTEEPEEAEEPKKSEEPETAFPSDVVDLAEPEQPENTTEEEQE